MRDKCKRINEKIVTNFVVPLRESVFYQKNFLQAFGYVIDHLKGRKIDRILCYGLGTFHSGVEVASRYQLALLLLIHERLVEEGMVGENMIEIFDPSFETLDTESLRYFSNPKFKVLENNEYCARKVTPDELTLIYMPHLDKYFYNNLIGANWNPSHLSSVVILGNSFQEMIDNETLSRSKLELYYMELLVRNFRCANSTPKTNKKGKKRQRDNSVSYSDEHTSNQALIEIKIDDGSFKHVDIFNNLAFHVISEDWLKENSHKVQQHRLNDWRCVESIHQEEDWLD